MSNIAYSAIVLDTKSREKLINYLNRKDLIPPNTEIIADHMTINMGEIDPQYVKYLGLPIRLRVEEYSMNDLVVAVSVSGFYSKQSKPHITIAVNRAAGGKPVMSNELTDWIKLSPPLTVVGKVTEVPYKF